MAAKILKFLFWMIIISFIILYPMLISIHVYLPLLIGFAGYMLVKGFDGYGMRYIWLPLIYLVNLEANLSLPLLLALMSIFLFYLTLYERIKILKRCPVCVGFLSVLAIDGYYFMVLLGYDFIFDTSSIVVDSLLLYSLIFDLIFVVLV